MVNWLKRNKYEAMKENDPVVIDPVVADPELKAKCEVCGGTNIHYEDGCLDCKAKIDSVAADPVVIKPVDLNKLTKDELNDLAAKNGFEKEIKPSMKQKTMVNKLKKLFGWN